MACTEIYLIKRRNKRMVLYSMVGGAMRGDLYLWAQVERKYLPSAPRPWYANPKEEYTSRITETMLHPKGEQAKELWDIPNRPEVSRRDRVLFAMSYDGAYTLYKDLPELAEMYRTCEYTNEHLTRRAELLDQIYKDYSEKDLFGVYILSNNVVSIPSSIVEYTKSDRYHERPRLNEASDDVFDVFAFADQAEAESDQNSCTSAE